MIKINKFNLYYFIITILFIIGFTIRIISLINNRFFIIGDECHSLYGSFVSFHDIFFKFIQGTNFLPLYRCLIKFIYEIWGLNFPIYKIFSLIAEFLSFFLFFKLLEKVYKNKLLIIFCVVLYCFNYSYIYFSHYIKPYSYDLLCMLLLLNLVFSNNLNKISLKKLIIYIFMSLIMVYSSLTSIVAIEIFSFLLLLKNIIYKNFENIFKIIIFQIFTITFILINYFSYIIQMKTDDGLKVQWLSDLYYFAPTSFKALNSILHFIFFEYQFSDKDIIGKLPNSVLFFILILFLIGSFLVCIKFKNYNGGGDKEKLSLKFDGLFLIVPVYFFLILSYLGIYPFCNRLILFLVPSIMIIIFKIFDYCGKNRLISIINILMIIVLSVSFFLYIKQINVLLPLINNNTMTLNTIERKKQLDKLTIDNTIITWENPCTYCNHYNKIVVDINNIINNNDFLVKYISKNNKEITDYIDISQALKEKNKILFINLGVENKDIIISKLISLGYKEENIKEISSHWNDLFYDYYLFIKN